jgi:hypothetical protein
MLATTGPDARRIAWTTPRLHPRTRGSFRGSLLARQRPPRNDPGCSAGCRADGETDRPVHSGKNIDGEGSHGPSTGEFDRVLLRSPAEPRLHMPGLDPPLGPRPTPVGPSSVVPPTVHDHVFATASFQRGQQLDRRGSLRPRRGEPDEALDQLLADVRCVNEGGLSAPTPAQPLMLGIEVDSSRRRPARNGHTGPTVPPGRA